MAQVRPYYAAGGLSAAFYDVVTAADGRLAGDVDVYAALIPAGGMVLELGTGTGRVAFALAKRGFSVTGVDISPTMLATAQARVQTTAPQLRARLAFRRGDMTALDLKRTFDAVICSYFTLAHVPAGAAWRNSFATMAKHLAAGGACAVHLPLQETMRGAAPPPDAVVLDQSLPGGGRLQLHVLEHRFREDIGRLDLTMDYVQRDAAGAVVRRSAERLTYYTADPRPFAAAAGLELAGPPERLGGVGDIWVFRRR